MRNFILLLVLIVIANVAFTYEHKDSLIVGDRQIPESSAALEVASTTQGFLNPRMTSVERDAIASPSQGLVIYNTTTNSLEIYNGAWWTAAGGGNLQGAYDASTSGDIVLSAAKTDVNITDNVIPIVGNLFTIFDNAISEIFGVTATGVNSLKTTTTNNTDTGTLSVGAAAPAADSVMDVVSTTKGTRPCPSMTEAQRDLIAAPATGLCIFNTDINKLNIYDGSTWVSAGGGLDAWVTAFSYKIGNVVHESNGIYLALTDHTSGVFATDLAALNWQELSTFREANFNITPPATTCAEGKLFWNSTDKTLNICTDQAGVSLQVGQEGHVRIYNNTGSTITNGQVVYINGYDVGNSLPTIALAQSNLSVTSTTVLGVATHDITTAGAGVITTWGLVRDLDTSAYSSGDILYLSSTVAGGFTTTPPDSPNFLVRVATVGKVDLTTGTINAAISIGNNKQDVISVFNGGILESHVVTIASDGTTVTATLSNSLGGNLSLFLDKVFYDFTAPANVTLTAGSDTSPTLNYVYIPNSTKTLTASTSGWPTEQHVPVGTFFVQSALSVQTDAPYKEHAWTDHMTGGDDQGHISHLNKWIRNQHATWLSGTAPTFAGSGTASITFSTTSGTVLQLHEHSIQAFASPAKVRVVNDSVTPYVALTDLANAVLDSTGSSLQGRTFALVIWGSVNETTGSSKLFMNLPSGSYSTASPDLVRTDSSKYTDYSIPDEFKGTGFLIHRLVIGINPPGTVWTIYSGEGDDVRGQFPNTVAGSSSTVATEFPDNAFAVFNVTDNTKEVVIDASGITTANTRTMTIPDGSGTLALLNSGTDQTFTQKVTSRNKNGDTLAYFDNDNVATSEWTSTLATATFGVETTNQLSGTTSYKITNAVGATGIVRSPAITIEKRTQNNLITTKFKYTYSGVNKAIRAYLYDVTNSVELGELYLNATTTVKGAVIYGNAANTTASIELRFDIPTPEVASLVFDDIEITDDPLASASINDAKETITYTGFTSRDGSGEVLFKTEKMDTGNRLIEADNIGAFTKYTMLKSVPVVVTGAGESATPTLINIRMWNSSGVEQLRSTNDTDSRGSSVMVVTPDIGDYFTINSAINLTDSSITAHFTIAATDSNDYLLIGGQNIEDYSSMIRLHTSNGKGSTGTTIRRFSVVEDNYGDAITYTDSATDGSSFTINEDGVYHVTYSDSRSGGGIHVGISLNASSLSLGINSLGASEVLDYDYSEVSDHPTSVSWSGKLVEGDIIRAQSNVSTGAAVTSFTIAHVKNNITTVALPQSEQQDFSVTASSAGALSEFDGAANWCTFTSKVTGKYTYDLDTTVFSVFPKIKPVSNEGGEWWTVTYLTFPQFRLDSYNHAGTAVDGVHQFGATKSGADASSGEVFGIEQFRPKQLAYIDVHATQYLGSVSVLATGTYYALPMVGVSGDVSGISASSNQVTLVKGTYDLEIPLNAWSVSGSGFLDLGIYSVTDSSYIEEHTEVAYRSSAGQSMQTTFKTTITLTATKTLEFRVKAPSMTCDAYTSRMLVERRQ